MRCAVHGDSINCPQFCTHQLRGTEDPGTPGGPEAGDLGRNTSELESGTDEHADHADASKARDLGLAQADIAGMRDTIERLQRQLVDAGDAIAYAQQQLQQTDALLVKYHQK